MKKSTDNSSTATAEALDLHGLQDDEPVPGCFEFHFRTRTRSFDLHHNSSFNKLSKLANMLKSKSDGNVKSASSVQPYGKLSSAKDSPKSSPRNSPHSPTRRRFMRVVRDSHEDDQENPHIIHKYSDKFLSDLQKSASLEECQLEPLKSASLEECQLGPLPYAVSGHTILKKNQLMGNTKMWASVDQVESHESSPILFPKHASFHDEVEVMEYDKMEDIGRGPLAKHKVRLQDPIDDTIGEDGEGIECQSREEEEENADSLEDSACVDLPSGKPSLNNTKYAHIFTSVTIPKEVSKERNSRPIPNRSKPTDNTKGSSSLQDLPTAAAADVSGIKRISKSMEKLKVKDSDKKNANASDPFYCYW